LVTMHAGEHAIIEMHNIDKYGYSKNKAPAKYPSSQADAEADALPIRYELIVIDSLAKQEESQNMTFCQQLRHANVLRERGNARYAKERFQTALGLYERAIQCLDAMRDVDMTMPEELEHTKVGGKEVMDCKVKCYLNCCICHRRLGDHNECIRWSSQAIDACESANPCKKGLIRRGLSHFDLGHYELAKKDFLNYQALTDLNEKERKMVKLYLLKLQLKKQKDMQRQRKIYGGFLDKNNEKGKGFELYEDKKENNDNGNVNDGWLWWLVMWVPNGLMYFVNECTKFCRSDKGKKKLS